MLMVRTNYDALVSGDGACAGCGEKSVLRSIAAVTEAYMRPVFHAKSDRLVGKAGQVEKTGVARLAAVKQRSEAEYKLLRQTIAHLIFGLGGEDDATPWRASRRTKRSMARLPTRRWWRQLQRYC